VPYYISSKRSFPGEKVEMRAGKLSQITYLLYKLCSGMEQLDLEDIIGSTPSAPIIPKASPARRSSILCVNCGKRDEVESMRLRFSHVQ